MLPGPCSPVPAGASHGDLAVRNKRVIEEELLDVLTPASSQVGSDMPVRRVPDPDRARQDGVQAFLEAGIEWLEPRKGTQPPASDDSMHFRMVLLSEQRSRLAARIASIQGEADRTERALRSQIATLRGRVAQLEAALVKRRVAEPGARALSDAGQFRPDEGGATAAVRNGARLCRQLILQRERDVAIWNLPDDRCYVGRGIEADIRLDHHTVSRLHGVLYCVGGAMIVEDARSTHGVFVNANRVQQAVLKDGDLVAFGEVAFSLRVVRPARQDDR